MGNMALQKLFETDNSINGSGFDCQSIFVGNRRILDVVFTYRLGCSVSDLVKDRIRADTPDQRYIPRNVAGKHRCMRETHRMAWPSRGG